MENKTMTAPETYTQQKKRHQDEISGFDGLFWAFSNEQLEEGKKKISIALGITCENKDLIGIGAGGFILRTQIKAFKDCMNRQAQERKDLKKDAKIFFNALVYELNNHEYCITYDATDALESLGLTKDDVDADILKKACKESIKQTC